MNNIFYQKIQEGSMMWSDLLQVYAIDLLGFGASDKPPLTYSTELWRDQLLDFLREFTDAPAVLIGNSIGSLISLMVRAASICPRKL